MTKINLYLLLMRNGLCLANPGLLKDKHRNTFLRREGAFLSSKLLYLYKTHPTEVTVLGDWEGVVHFLSKHGNVFL
jgi:hypothetical protein